MERRKWRAQFVSNDGCSTVNAYRGRERERGRARSKEIKGQKKGKESSVALNLIDGAGGEATV